MGNNIFLIQILFFLLYNDMTINCVLEIPLSRVQVQGIPKYPNIKIVEPEKITNISTLNKKIFIDEGTTTINGNELFIAKIKIGSNNQEFNLLFDTGSYLLWVAGINSNDAYMIKNHYNPEKSDTYEKLNEPCSIKYGSGSCKGYYYLDYFKYIKDKKFQLKFVVASETDFNVEGVDGIIGLGLNYRDKTTSFIQMLKEGGVTDSMKFSFKFNNFAVGEVGKLYIGKHKDFNSDTAYCPLLATTYSKFSFWMCTMTSFGIKTSLFEQTSKKSYDIIFDTGTNFIILPLEYLNDLKSTLSKFNCREFQSDSLSSFQIACSRDSQLPDFTFEINNYVLTIPYYYTFYATSQYKNVAFSRILFQKSDYYIVGSPFFFAFHTLFDKDNEILAFYPEKSNYLIRNKNYFVIVMVSFVLILLFISLVYLIYRFIKMRRNVNKAQANNFPYNNYNASLY